MPQSDPTVNYDTQFLSALRQKLYAADTLFKKEIALRAISSLRANDNVVINNDSDTAWVSILSATSLEPLSAVSGSHTR